jgi:hypothetical protein
LAWGSLAPPFALEQRVDALTDLVTDLAHASEVLALRTVQRPVIALDVRHHWTLISASHRDQYLSSLCERDRQFQ